MNMSRIGHGERLFLDSLPPADADILLAFENFHGAGMNTCRARLYRSERPVIILTDDPESEGTSITNRAERAHYLAWKCLREPADPLFVEHYMGNRYNGRRMHPAALARGLREDPETFDLVTFAPRLLPFRETTRDRDSGRVTYSAYPFQFGAVSWESLSRDDVSCLIRKPLCAEPVT